MFDKRRIRSTLSSNGLAAGVFFVPAAGRASVAVEAGIAKCRIRSILSLNILDSFV
jgi:hypothetical protein